MNEYYLDRLFHSVKYKFNLQVLSCYCSVVDDLKCDVNDQLYSKEPKQTFLLFKIILIFQLMLLRTPIRNNDIYHIYWSSY